MSTISITQHSAIHVPLHAFVVQSPPRGLRDVKCYVKRGSFLLSHFVFPSPPLSRRSMLLVSMFLLPPTPCLPPAASPSCPLLPPHNPHAPLPLAPPPLAPPPLASPPLAPPTFSCPHPLMSHPTFSCPTPHTLAPSCPTFLLPR